MNASQEALARTKIDIACEDPLIEPVPSPDACPDDVLMPSLDDKGFCRKSGSISPVFAGLCKEIITAEP